MQFRYTRTEVPVRLVVDNSRNPHGIPPMEATPQGVTLATVFHRRFPGTIIAQHAVWFPKDSPGLREGMTAFEHLPSYLRQRGIVPIEDIESKCFWWFFYGGESAPEEMRQALEDAGIDAVTHEVYPDPAYVTVITAPEADTLKSPTTAGR